MKIKLLLAFFVIANFAKSQTHRFIYDVEFKKDSLSSVTTKENYHLDITDKSAVYYTRDYFTADSLIVNNIPFADNMKLETSEISTHAIGSDIYET